jgi:rRNA maturation protein Nop10
MFLIFGVQNGEKTFRIKGSFICPVCGRRTGVSVVMTYYYFSLFFIPLFSWGRSYYVVTECCNAAAPLDAQTGDSVRRGKTDTFTDIDDLDFSGYDGMFSSFGNTAPFLRRCPHCGYKTYENFDYCPKCGSKMEDDSK